MGWKTTIDAILAERRERLGAAPSLDELIALRAGTLSEAAREQVLERAAADPAVAEALREALRFPDVEATEAEDDRPGDETLSDTGVDARWQAMRARLVGEGDLPAARPTAPTVATFPSPEPPPPAWRVWLPRAAAFLLGAGLALVATRAPDTGPHPATADAQVNLPIVELVPTDESAAVRQRDTAETVTLAADADGLVVTLAVPAAAAPAAAGPYRLELSRPDGAVVVVSGLMPGVGGVFVLTLPRADLGNGKHTSTLHDAAGTVIARFAFEVAPPR